MMKIKSDIVRKYDEIIGITDKSSRFIIAANGSFIKMRTKDTDKLFRFIGRDIKECFGWYNHLNTIKITNVNPSHVNVELSFYNENNDREYRYTELYDVRIDKLKSLLNSHGFFSGC